MAGSAGRGGGAQGVFHVLVGEDFDGDAVALRVLAFVLAEIEAEQAQRAFGNPAGDAGIAFRPVLMRLCPRRRDPGAPDIAR